MIKIVSKNVPKMKDAWLVVIKEKYFTVQVLTGANIRCGVFLSNELGETITGKFIIWKAIGSKYTALADLMDVYDKGWREQVNGIQWVED